MAFAGESQNNSETGPGGIPVHPEWPYTMASRTIPLMHINTEDLRPIVDKVNYLTGFACVEVPEGQDNWEALASLKDPVELEIRGRGNFSWFNTEKKAYKLKFKKKTSLFGMPANKHYALIGYDMFYTSGWLAPYVGMELSRIIQPDWVPRMQPVEVILNGEYRGLYLLVESIKIASGRLDIEVQEEEETDPQKIAAGGWLVELDNQDDEFQVTVPCENANSFLRVTHKEPEVISDAQREWLVNEFTHLSELIDHPESFLSEKWEDHFDLPSLARYMVIREYLHDLDGYSGSQYFHRSAGTDKWIAGPMWDLEVWPEKKPGWIRDFPRWSLMNWIPNMMRSAELREAFIQEWDTFYPEKQQVLLGFIDDVSEVYKHAHLANASRWPVEARPIDETVSQLKADLAYNGEWINAHKNWDLTNGIIGVEDNPSGSMISVGMVGSSLSIKVHERCGIRIFSSQGVMLIAETLVEGDNAIDLSGSHISGQLLILLVEFPDGSRESIKVIL